MHSVYVLQFRFGNRRFFAVCSFVHFDIAHHDGLSIGVARIHSTDFCELKPISAHLRSTRASVCTAAANDKYPLKWCCVWAHSLIDLYDELKHSMGNLVLLKRITWIFSLTTNLQFFSLSAENNCVFFSSCAICFLLCVLQCARERFSAMCFRECLPKTVWVGRACAHIWN